MTLAVASAGSHERRTRWLGALAVFLMVMTPLIGYLAPLGFAPLLSVVGLLATPGLARSRPPLLPSPGSELRELGRLLDVLESEFDDR